MGKSVETINAELAAWEKKLADLYLKWDRASDLCEPTKDLNDKIDIVLEEIRKLQDLRTNLTKDEK